MPTDPWLRLLHLSDLALCQDEAWRQRGTLRGLLEFLRPLSIDLVVITGDITATGHKADFAEAQRWLEEDLLPALKLGPDRLLLVPGERDMDREALSPTAEYVAQGLRCDGQKAIARLLGTPDERAVLNKRLKSWVAFAKTLRGKPRLNLPWSSTNLEIRGRSIDIACLCSAWAATGETSDKGRLLVGERQVQELLPAESKADLRVALLHHPLAWLHPIDGGVERILSQRVDLLLHGHEARFGVCVSERHDRPLVEVCAGSATGERGSAALIELDETHTRVTPLCHLDQGWRRDTTRAGNAEGVMLKPRAFAAQVDAAPARSPWVEPLRPCPAPRLGQLPTEPYPLLARYEDFRSFGGRDKDLRTLLALLNQEGLVWTLYARSGAGKSSLLQAGLLPALWGQTGLPQRPVALGHRPAAPGLAQRLLSELLLNAPPIGDDDPLAFAAVLAQLRDQVGQRPVLILDQFEEVFDARGPRSPLSWLGPLMAATKVAPGGRAARWVLAYRHEFHGRVQHWLADVLRHAPQVKGLPHDLLRPDTCTGWVLPLLGEASRAHDPLQTAAAAFEDAILRPLRLQPPAYSLRLDPASARRLALAFAQARQDSPDDPLTPELQVVLARLIRDTPLGPDQICAPVVPQDAAALRDQIHQAIGDHLHILLDKVVAGAPPPQLRGRRSQARLVRAPRVNEAGRRWALPVDQLLSGLGDEARGLYDRFKASGVRLIREEWQGPVCMATLPHDRVAAEVRGLLEQPEALAQAGLDGDTIGLWRLVDQRAAAWRAGDPESVQVDGERMSALLEHEGAFPWDAHTRSWWDAAQVAYRERDRQQTLDRVRSTQPRSGHPIRALHRLHKVLGLDGAALAQALRVEPGHPHALDAQRREEIFGLGPWGLNEAERVEVLPDLVEALASFVADAPGAESLWGGLLAAVEVVGFYDQAAAEQAREAVVSAMRAARGVPPPLEPADWSPIIAGRFQVGCFREAGDEGPDDETLHEVELSPYRLGRNAISLEEYWRFAPQHQSRANYPGAWPALQVSWYEAMAYAAWAGAALPTEAQWEVAARGGRAQDYRKTAYYNGNGEEALDKVGHHVGSHRRHGARPLATREPIAGAPPHPLGLVHVHGNILEWCRDWFGPYPDGLCADPRGPAVPPDPAKSWRVLRGGSWLLSAVYSRSAVRFRDEPSNRLNNVGFRLSFPQPLGPGS